MNDHVVEASQVSGYILRIKFGDGTEGEIDLERELTAGVFKPLRDPKQFGLFRVDSEFHTLMWPEPTLLQSFCASMCVLCVKTLQCERGIAPRPLHSA